MNISEQKAAIRRMIKQREAEFLAEGNAGPESERILAAVENLPEFISASHVLVYMSIPGEVLTGEFLSRWHPSKHLVLPRVKANLLELREYDPNLLCKGYMGILEPSDDAPVVSPSDIDFAIIPGVAFATMRAADGAARRWRMGRGKGFYDRLLPLLNCPVAGVGFDFRNLEEIPIDPWDVPLDY